MIQKTMVDLAQKAGQTMLEHYKKIDESAIELKGERIKDLLTEVDGRIEDMTREALRKAFPDHGFLGEERGKSSGGDAWFLLDPIDGTVNFASGLPEFAFLLTRMEGDRPTHSVTHLPVFGETYWAQAGHGAWLNGQRISVNRAVTLSESVVATGFACVRAGQKPDNLPIISDILYKVRGLRRFGSAGVDLAYVARGAFAGFWEIGLSPWDVAAGILLVKEAGGCVSGFSGVDDPIRGGRIVASNGIIHEELRAVVEKNFHEE